MFKGLNISGAKWVRSGILASRSPVGIGMTQFSAAFPSGVKSYPEYLRESGYYTGLASRTYHQEGYNSKGDVRGDANGELKYYRFDDRYQIQCQQFDAPNTLNR
jgi:arylsulfatase A-like enzyme